jgi:hypothetical protein
MLGFLAAALAASLAGSIVQSESADVLVGVLEHGFERNWKDNSVGAEFKQVRLAFRHREGGWEAFPHRPSDQEALRLIPRNFPETVDWTVTFDGRSVGAISTRRRDVLAHYGQVGLFDVTSVDVPVIGKASDRSAFVGATFARVYRPLVVVTGSRAADPDGWKAIVADATTRAKAIARFRTEIPKIESCDPVSGNGLALREYADREIKVLRGYVSKTGTRVVSLVFAPSRDVCEHGDEEAPDILTHTYSIDRAGGVLSLGTGMTLIDAGDYDGDGRSELIFLWTEGDNRDGYVLFANDFRDRVRFYWNYH